MTEYSYVRGSKIKKAYHVREREGLLYSLLAFSTNKRQLECSSRQFMCQFPPSRSPASGSGSGTLFIKRDSSSMRVPAPLSLGARFYETPTAMTIRRV